MTVQSGPAPTSRVLLMVGASGEVILYVPGGRKTIPPEAGSAFIAAWIAGAELLTPAGSAPPENAALSTLNPAPIAVSASTTAFMSAGGLPTPTVRVSGGSVYWGGMPARSSGNGPGSSPACRGRAVPHQPGYSPERQLTPACEPAPAVTAAVLPLAGAADAADVPAASPG